MENNTNVMTETTPQEEALQTNEATVEVAENTTDNTTVESEENTPNENTTEQTEAQGNGSEAETVPPTPAPTVSIRFNHRTEELSLEDAAIWAQKGKAAESSMAKMRYLAASMGKGVNEVLSFLIDANDKKRKAELLEEVGGNEAAAEELLATRTAKIQKAVEDMIASEKAEQERDEQDLSDRLAKDFGELSQEVPEFKAINDVPKAVVNEAIKKNISLYDAYLRYERKQKQSVEKAQKQAESIKQSTNGSLSSAEKASGTQDFSAFNSGVWGYKH